MTAFGFSFVFCAWSSRLISEEVLQFAEGRWQRTLERRATVRLQGAALPWRLISKENTWICRWSQHSTSATHFPPDKCRVGILAYNVLENFQMPFRALSSILTRNQVLFLFFANLSFNISDADFIYHSCFDDLHFFFFPQFIYKSGSISGSHASAGILSADSIIEWLFKSGNAGNWKCKEVEGGLTENSWGSARAEARGGCAVVVFPRKLR